MGNFGRNVGWMYRRMLDEVRSRRVVIEDWLWIKVIDSRAPLSTVSKASSWRVLGVQKTGGFSAKSMKTSEGVGLGKWNGEVKKDRVIC
jgi:hypothetical protein